jgi:hypothetical protein
MKKPKSKPTTYIVPDADALDRILATIELGPHWHGRSVAEVRSELRWFLSLAVDELNKRVLLQQIGYAHADLDRLLRELGHGRGRVANQIADIMQRELLTARRDVGASGDRKRPGLRIVALTWSIEMLMGNYLLEVYAVLTGQLPKTSREGSSKESGAGTTAKFVIEALKALGVEESEDAVIKAMQRWAATEVYKNRAPA